MPELLSIDGIDLRGQGFGAATRTGRYNMPERRGENMTLTGASGSTFAANKPFEEGSGVLTLWAIGAFTAGDGRISIPSTFSAQRQQFETNMQTLMRLFTRPHKLSTIRAAQPDGSVRRALVEWKEWSEPDVQAGGTRAEWSIAYVIPDVWWEDEANTVQSSVASATLPHTLNLTSFTDMTGFIEDSYITVNGPITNPRVTDSETGAWVQYTGSVVDSWTIDSKNWTSIVGSGSGLAATTHSGSYRLLTIPNCYGATNTPRLVLSGTGGGATTRLTVTAKRKWVNG